MKLFLILLLLVSSQAFADNGSGNISNIINLGPSGAFGVLGISSAISGSGSTGTGPLKVLSAMAISTTTGQFDSLIDPSTGAKYQSPANTSVEVLGYCNNAGSVSAPNYNFQIGYSAGAVPTEGAHSAPTTPVYLCGADEIWCFPATNTAYVNTCTQTHFVIPGSAQKYLWIESNGPTSSNNSWFQVFIREF